MPKAYQIDSVEDITIGEVRTVKEIGEDCFAILSNGQEIQLGVPLCEGCDEHVFAGATCSCGIEWEEDFVA